MADVKFEYDLDSPLMMVKSEPTKGKKLMIFFGGMAGKLDMPTFEFLFLSNTIDDEWAFLFFKDLGTTWYHDIFDPVATGIREYIEKYEPTEIVTVGNSMGGYGAIMFGIEFNVDRVVSFIPQTCVIPEHPIVEPGYGALTKRVMDDRYSKRYFDLAEVPHDDFPVVDLWYTNSDIVHAQHLTKVPTVNLHMVEVGGHSVVPHLMKTKNLVKKILQGEYNAE